MQLLLSPLNGLSHSHFSNCLASCFRGSEWVVAWGLVASRVWTTQTHNFSFDFETKQKIPEILCHFSGYRWKSLLQRRVARLTVSCFSLRKSWRSFYFSLRWLKSRSPVLKWAFMHAGILSSVITQHIFWIYFSSSPEILPKIYWKVILAIYQPLKDLKKMPSEEQSQHPQAVLKAPQYSECSPYFHACTQKSQSFSLKAMNRHVKLFIIINSFSWKMVLFS